MENVLEKLEEFVLDDDKIVTIASLASDTNISLPDAKEVLKSFVENHKGSGKIHATYILNGTTKKDQQNHIAVVKDTELENKKELFEGDVIQTVFSVQKSDILDFNLIALADPFNEKVVGGPLPGLIVSKNCTKRIIKRKVLPPSALTQQPKPSIFGKQNSIKSDDSIKSEKNGGEASSSVKSESNKPKSSQGGIANMFNKMSQNKSNESLPKQEKEKQHKPNPKNAGITGFFTKMSSSSESIGKNTQKSEEKVVAPKKEPSSKQEEETEEVRKGDVKKKEDLFDSDSNEEVEQMMMQMDTEVVKEEKRKDPVKKKEEKKQVKKRRAKNSSENSQSAKRRKRIIIAEDSDSDDIFASSDKEESNLSEPEEQPVEDVVKKPLAPKNKRRKAVDKTYQDEEGFIVTKTEYIYETASEDENEEPPKKITPEQKPKSTLLSKKSNSSNSDMDVVDGTPQKGKAGKKGAKKSTGIQPTLMNFFTKK